MFNVCIAWSKTLAIFCREIIAGIAPRLMRENSLLASPTLFPEVMRLWDEIFCFPHKLLEGRYMTIFIDCNLVKQGYNVLGSACPSIFPFVRLMVLQHSHASQKSRCCGWVGELINFRYSVQEIFTIVKAIVLTRSGHINSLGK